MFNPPFEIRLCFLNFNSLPIFMCSKSASLKRKPVVKEIGQYSTNRSMQNAVIQEVTWKTSHLNCYLQIKGTPAILSR